MPSSSRTPCGISSPPSSFPPDFERDRPLFIPGIRKLGDAENEEKEADTSIPEERPELRLDKLGVRQSPESVCDLTRNSSGMAESEVHFDVEVISGEESLMVAVEPEENIVVVVGVEPSIVWRDGEDVMSSASSGPALR